MMDNVREEEVKSAAKTLAELSKNIVKRVANDDDVDVDKG